MLHKLKYADLLNDYVFKLVFGQESSKDVMIEFLNQVIDDRNIVDLEFMDKEMKSMDREKKDSVYDMFCKTDDDSRIVVEVQRRKQTTYVERSIYYSTFQVRNQVDAGSSDYAFCPVYVINILSVNRAWVLSSRRWYTVFTAGLPLFSSMLKSKMLIT